MSPAPLGVALIGGGFMADVHSRAARAAGADAVDVYCDVGAFTLAETLGRAGWAWAWRVIHHRPQMPGLFSICSTDQAASASVAGCTTNRR